jgi:tRNA pseudouridine38-40 synthase
MEYLGSAFEGWQIQARGRTVQGILRETLTRFLREDINPLGSGRTDAGVHALSQYANFTTSNPMKPPLIMHKLNRMLPDDIVVTGCQEVPLSFNSRRDALSRSYRYLICERPSAVNRGVAWILGRKLDIGLLNGLALATLDARHFGNFCKTRSRKPENHCSIKRSRWSRYGGLLRYEITADRFLHNMVRLLVGAMVAVALGKIESSRFRRMLGREVKDKNKYIAPPEGLYLVGARYEGIKL